MWLAISPFPVFMLCSSNPPLAVALFNTDVRSGIRRGLMKANRLIFGNVKQLLQTSHISSDLQ